MHLGAEQENVSRSPSRSNPGRYYAAIVQLIGRGWRHCTPTDHRRAMMGVRDVWACRSGLAAAEIHELRVLITHR